MANEKVLGLVSGTRDGKLLVVTTPTRCDPPATGEVYAGLVSGTRNGKPLLAFSTQRCGDTAGTLENGQTYLGLVSGTRDGKPLLVVPCGDCAPECDDCSCPCPGGTVYPAGITATIDISCFSAPFTIEMTQTVIPTDASCGPADDYFEPGYEVGDSQLIGQWDGYFSETGDEGTYTSNPCDGSPSSSILTGESRTCEVSLRLWRFVEEGGCTDVFWDCYVNANENVASDPVFKDALIADRSSCYPGPAYDCGGSPCPETLSINDCSPLNITSNGDIACELDGWSGENGYTSYNECDGATYSIEFTPT